MNAWLRLGFAALALCLGAACGTMRSAGPASAHASAARSGLERGQTGLRSDARPLTPALSPGGGEGEEASVSSAATVTPPAARAGDLQSPSLRVTSAPDGGCKPPTRRLQKWNPVWWFGNVDDPEPPEWYRPGSPNRRWLWQLRNPLHNFTFYVIGVADKPFTRTGKFPAAVFAPAGGWNWAVTRDGWLRLPFVSFTGERGRFYFGWRERGNFGCKVNLGKLSPPDPKPQTLDPNSSADLK